MKSLLILGLCVFSCVAQADGVAKRSLSEKMLGMEVSQLGVCDGMRTALVIYRSVDAKIAYEFVSLSGVRYIVIEDAGGAAETKKHYFTRRGDEVIENEKPMDWGVPLLRDGPNFFNFHFFPDRPNDCVLAQPMK